MVGNEVTNALAYYGKIKNYDRIKFSVTSLRGSTIKAFTSAKIHESDFAIS